MAPLQAVFNHKTCRAVIDFDVPGKPNPPPCSLIATLWEMTGPEGKSKYTIEYVAPCVA